jgi:hypothetical protein
MFKQSALPVRTGIKPIIIGLECEQIQEDKVSYSTPAISDEYQP